MLASVLTLAPLAVGVATPFAVPGRRWLPLFFSIYWGKVGFILFTKLLEVLCSILLCVGIVGIYEPKLCSDLLDFRVDCRPTNRVKLDLLGGRDTVLAGFEVDDNKAITLHVVRIRFGTQPRIGVQPIRE